MKNLAALCVLLMMTGSIRAAEPGQRVEDISLYDQHGDLHQLSRYSNRNSIVLLTSSNECPLSSEIATAYASIESRFFDLGFVFMLLDSSTATDRDTVNREISQLGLQLPVLMDENQRVSQSLGVRKTDEVLVFDPKTLTVAYRGSVDRNLEMALFTLLAGEEVMNSVSNTSGCEIAYLTDQQ
jgi:peroxiredoxin